MFARGGIPVEHGGNGRQRRPVWWETFLKLRNTHPPEADPPSGEKNTKRPVWWDAVFEQKKDNEGRMGKIFLGELVRASLDVGR